MRPCLKVSAMLPKKPDSDLVDLPRAQDLPPFMGQLRDRYLTTETGQFVLHGNVHDIVLAGGRTWSMPTFLDAFFTPSGKVVVHYDPGRGLYFGRPEHATRAAKVLCEAGFFDERTLLAKAGSKGGLGEALSREVGIERRPEIVLPLLEALLTRRDTPVAVIIHYADLVAPEAVASGLSFADRTAMATIHRWSLWEEVVRSDNLVILLTSTLSDLSRRISRNARVGVIQVPLPGNIDRARFLAHTRPTLDADRGEQLTRVTAGLQLRHIEDIMNQGSAQTLAVAPVPHGEGETRSLFRHAPENVPLEEVAAKRVEMLEQECAGLIEVMSPGHDFSKVGGCEHIKQTLLKVSGHIKAGRTSQVPMGILLVGPMGTGKSYIAEAFAAECGLAAIKLKNIRGPYVGVTESNLEKVLNIIEALGEIVVIIDEGDRAIGGQGSGGDGGVDSRVVARLKEFMSDTSHRGRILFMMMTNRPDKLDTDLKRAGRFDLKIPFFFPQSGAERLAILRAQMKRYRVDADAITDEEVLPLLEPLEGYSAADIEAALLIANDDYLSDELPAGMEVRPPQMTVAFLVRAFSDYMPSRELHMLSYMEWLAVSEASNRRLLPERYRLVTVEELTERLAESRDRARLR